MSRRRIVVASIGLVAVLLALVTPSPPARRVIVTFPGQPEDYAVLPDGRVLWHVFTGPLRVIDPRIGKDRAADAIIQAFRRDAQLKRALPNGPTDWTPSPDGRWILTQTAVGNANLVIVASTDGRVVRKVRVNGDQLKVTWLWDSQSWITADGSEGISMATYDRDGRLTKTQIVPECDGLEGPSLPNLRIVAQHSGDTHTIALQSGGAKPRWLWGADEGLPGSSWETNAALSPSGRKVALAVMDSGGRPFLGIRWLSFLPVRTASVETRVDMYDVRTGSRQALDSAESHYGNDEFDLVTWSADGQYVRYVYGNQLCETPVQ